MGYYCHCEERSDAAILCSEIASLAYGRLAMTIKRKAEK